MRAIEILEQVLRLNETELQGLLYPLKGCSQSETFKYWFGDIPTEIEFDSGLFDDDSVYFYTTGVPLNCIEDIRLKQYEITIYIYQVDIFASLFK